MNLIFFKRLSFFVLTIMILIGCKPCPTCDDCKVKQELYFERTEDFAKSPDAEHEEGIHPISDRIKLTVPEDGNYLILAKGTYEGVAYNIVDVCLYIYNGNSPLYKQTIKNNYNLVRDPETNYSIRNSINSKSQEIVGLIKYTTTHKLKKGDEIELRYGNFDIDGQSTPVKQRMFRFAYKGDFIALIKLPN